MMPSPQKKPIIFKWYPNFVTHENAHVTSFSIMTQRKSSAPLFKTLEHLLSGPVTVFNENLKYEHGLPIKNGY